MSTLPTGKSHVSFSEVRCWLGCTWQHKLIHIDKLSKFEDSIYSDYGTIAHDACEQYLKTKVIDKPAAIEKLTKLWEDRGYPNVPNWPRFASAVPELKYWVDSLDFLDDLPAFLDETFPGWECISAEEGLFEEIKTVEGVDFKGFVDAVLKVPGKKGKFLYWIIDWKTAASYGWRRQKKQDPLVQMQLRLYKHFWAQKNNVPLGEIRCAFVLLKRGAKKNRCGLVPVSVGDVTRERDLKRVESMISLVKSGFTPKNRYGCTFCEFKDTEHCKPNL